MVISTIYFRINLKSSLKRFSHRFTPITLFDFIAAPACLGHSSEGVLWFYGVDPIYVVLLKINLGLNPVSIRIRD